MCLPRVVFLEWRSMVLIKVFLNNDKKITVISFGLRPEEEREGPGIEMAVGCRAATFHGEES